jgi:hypothetical protein
MTAKSALLTVLVFSITFACVGATIGSSIGVLAPDYYRAVIRLRAGQNFNPTHVGIGLGATQGVSAGVATSLAVLAILAWRDIRFARLAEKKVSNHPRSTATWTVHALWGTAVAISLVLVGAGAFALGGIIAQQQLYQLWTDRKLEKIATILASGGFEGVEADYSSAAQVYLTGKLSDNATREELYRQLVDAFGIDEAEKMLGNVDVVR